MIATRLRQFAVIALAASLALMPHAYAADSSPWNGDARSSVRLVAGAQSFDSAGYLLAGVELWLAPGWKTYWRYPGDSGVPPRFEFRQSANVKSATVRWPLPRRFADETGQSIGYKDAVIFPVHVVPQDPAQPVTLRLQLEYAVCERLCVPAQASSELTLGATSTHEAALAMAEALVPKPVTLGTGRGLAIRDVRRELQGGRSRVIVDVAAPEHGAVDLFAEGPTPAWALPLPEPVAEAPANLRRFAFDLVGMPAGASVDHTTLTLTATAGGSAIEVKARLD